jgi:hypothetical protein
VEVSSSVSGGDVGSESVVGLTGSLEPVGSVVNSLDGGDSSSVVGFVRCAPSGGPGVSDSPGSGLLLGGGNPSVVGSAGGSSSSQFDSRPLSVHVSLSVDGSSNSVVSVFSPVSSGLVGRLESSVFALVNVEEESSSSGPAGSVLVSPVFVSGGLSEGSVSGVSNTSGFDDVSSGSEVLSNEVSSLLHHVGGVLGVAAVASDVGGPDGGAAEVAVEGSVVLEGVLGNVVLGGDGDGEGEGGEGESHVGKWRKLG